MSDKKTVSVVMPARNEEGNLPRAYEEVTAAFGNLPEYDYEVVIIDNASEDQTPDRAREICAKDKRWKYLRFSRNFGAEASITVGMRVASGNAVINVFSDLQDPPDRIPDFVKKWEEGYDVVCGVIRDRQDSYAARGFFARCAYRLIHLCSDIDLPNDSGDFRLLDRKAVDAFNRLNERERYVRGLMHWVGFKTTEIEYDRRPRQWGSSKAPFWWCFYFALNAITSFSTKPLRVFTLFGFAVLLISMLATVYYVAGKFMTNPPPGVTTTLVLLLWNLAIMSLGIGIVGEYIGHIYKETKQRPLFVIDDFKNLDASRVNDLVKNSQ